MADTVEISCMTNNQNVQGTFLVSNISSMPFKDITKGNYIVFNIVDKKGTIPAKIWNNASTYMPILNSGKVFKITGKINTYQGQNQLIVSSIEKAKNYNPTDFLPTSKFDPDEMWTELIQIMDENITDEHMKKLWEKYRDNKKFVQNFLMCPGGKGSVHHAYLHGLLEHTLCVLKICASFCKTYPIDSSTICMGAFLHDHGKMLAYSYDLSIEMTDVGRLHSHLNLSYSNVTPIINTLEIPIERKREMKLILGHLILSHHGTLEMGAAVVPMTAEAILLAKADMIDSEYNLSVIYTDKITEGHWSSYDPLKGKYYYKNS